MSKYIVYAVGEILLVVIGILIALQINNWNGERLDRKTETEILTRMVHDLNKDLQDLALASHYHERRMIRGVWVLEQMGHDMSYLTQSSTYQRALRNQSDLQIAADAVFGIELLSLRGYHLFEESPIAFQEILSTGKLDIIRDAELRTRIQTHYTDLDRRKRLQRLIVQNRDELIRYLRGHGISIVNSLSMPEVLGYIDNSRELMAITENFVFITRVVYERIVVQEDSVQGLTESLITDIEQYLEERR